MKNNSNTLVKTPCESSEFVLCQASVANTCARAQGKLTTIHKVDSLDIGIVQLNQMETSNTFYNEDMKSLFVVKDLPLEAAVVEPEQLAQPLKGLNSVVSDTVGFAIFCVLLIATGMLVWSNFS